MDTNGHLPAGRWAGRGPVVSLRLADGSVVHRRLRETAAVEVIRAVPWRQARSVRGQAHLPGLYWAATTGGHVMYESRLEMARLLVADFEPRVAAISAQPFLLHAEVAGRLRRHVPDFLLVHTDGSVLLVNVKPAERLTDPMVTEALAWPGQLAEEHGWGYEIWTGDEAVYLANLRFLAGYRRPGLISDEALASVLEAVEPGDTVGTLIGRGGWHRRPGEVRAAVLRLLWQQRLRVDLRRRLDAGSRVEAVS